MQIDYLAHACFMITGDSGTRIVFDPYEPGAFGNALRYDPPGVEADLVFLSHEHGDHGAFGQIAGEPLVVRDEEEGSAAGVSWKSLSVFHDDQHGAARGTNLIFNVSIDGVSFCHLGDLGHVLDSGAVRKLQSVDVLMVPVGGYFTIDAAQAVEVIRAIEPRVAIPMHFKTGKVDFPIAPLKEFLAASVWESESRGSSTEFTVEKLPSGTVVWEMQPSR